MDATLQDITAGTYRSSIDSKVIGYFTTVTAAKKALSVKAIRQIGGGYSAGYIDLFDPNDDIKPGWESFGGGWKTEWTRLQGRGVEAGWIHNN